MLDVGATPSPSEEIESLKAQLQTCKSNYASLQKFTTLYAESKEAMPTGPFSCALACSTPPLTAQMSKWYKEVGMQRAYFIGEHDILDSDLEYDAEKFIKKIRSLIPRFFTGEVILDIEGQALTEAQSEQGDARRDQFAEIIGDAQDERPDVSWSFYGLSPRAEWKTDEYLEEVNERVSSLMSLCDSVTLTLYRFYKDGLYEGEQAASNTKTDWRSIKAAKVHGLPLNVCVMDIYHDAGTQPYRGTPINPVELAAYIRNLSQSGADRIVWWLQDKDQSPQRAEKFLRSVLPGLLP